jgi:hypothetical protein
VAENAGSLEHNGAVYNFNTAARYDLPMAVTTICEYLNRTDPIAILGHCMGSAILAEAVALGHVRPNEVDCIVLSALGLFYETPIDGRLKSEERILEQLQVESEGQGRPCVSINPTVVGAPGPSWPEKLDDLYQKWPARLKSHIKTLSGAETPAIVECDLAREMCNRVGFMYGAPYHHDNLIDEIHGTDHISPELRNQFGAIPLHMYIHGARNTRRGRATYYVLPTDDPELASKRAAELLSDDEVRERFKAMKKVTLMTGALNRLWHRDSIDLMYEWLRRGVSKHPCQFTKRVFPEYGHQDLFWGKNSADDVFPTIKDGLD